MIFKNKKHQSKYVILLLIISILGLITSCGKKNKTDLSESNTSSASSKENSETRESKNTSSKESESSEVISSSSIPQSAAQSSATAQQSQQSKPNIQNSENKQSSTVSQSEAVSSSDSYEQQVTSHAPTQESRQQNQTVTNEQSSVSEVYQPSTTYQAPMNDSPQNNIPQSSIAPYSQPIPSETTTTGSSNGGSDSVTNVIVGMNITIDNNGNYVYNNNGTDLICTVHSGQDVVDKLNAYRSQNGLSTLIVDTDLTTLAKARAIETTQNFSHTRPDGSTVLTTGYSWGENLTYGSGNYNADSAMNSWKNSPSHNENMLRSEFTKVGVACVTTSTGLTYWVQIFAY